MSQKGGIYEIKKNNGWDITKFTIFCEYLIKRGQSLWKLKDFFHYIYYFS